MKNLNLYKGFENLVEKMKKNGVNVEKSALQKRLLAIGLAPILLTSGIAVGCDNNEPVEIVEEEKEEELEEEKEEELEENKEEQIDDEPEEVDYEALEKEKLERLWSKMVRHEASDEALEYLWDVKDYFMFSDFINEETGEKVDVEELKGNYGERWVQLYAYNIPHIDRVKIMIIEGLMFDFKGMMPFNQVDSYLLGPIVAVDGLKTGRSDHDEAMHIVNKVFERRIEIEKMFSRENSQEHADFLRFMNYSRNVQGNYYEVRNIDHVREETTVYHTAHILGVVEEFHETFPKYGINVTNIYEEPEFLYEILPDEYKDIDFEALNNK